MRDRIKLNPKTKLIWAKVITLLFYHKRVKTFIDDSAFIGESTNIGNNVIIYKNCSIGENCKIGNNTILMENVIIGDNVHIGNECTVFPNSILNYRLAGKQCSSGVVIGNHVEIGANCKLCPSDKDSIIIGDYTKVNNLCCFNGNILIGKNVIITGKVEIESNTVIEDYVYLAPKAIIKSNSLISNNSQVGMMAVVDGVIPPNEIWVGNPIKFLKKRS